MGLLPCGRLERWVNSSSFFTAAASSLLCHNRAGRVLGINLWHRFTNCTRSLYHRDIQREASPSVKLTEYCRHALFSRFSFPLCIFVFLDSTTSLYSSLIIFTIALLISSFCRKQSAKTLQVGECTLPWAIFRFRIFSNCFSQKFEKIKITVWKSEILTMYGKFCLDLYQYYYL